MTNTEKCYIVLQKDAKIYGRTAHLKDLADVFCRDTEKERAIKKMAVITCTETRVEVIGTLFLVKKIAELCDNTEVECLGATECVAEFLPEADKERAVSTGKRLRHAGKIFFVCLLCFFGTAFTIMAYHNDIGITGVFRQVDAILGGDGSLVTLMGICYSVGLCGGVLLFFNHFGKHRFDDDPTPIEVEMRVYEGEITDTTAERAKRSGKVHSS